MPVNINYAPDANLVGQAAYQGGLGDYNRWASGMALQQRQLDQQKLLTQQQMKVSEWQTQYGAASDQFMQKQGINNQQTMQLRDVANQDYLQQNSLANSRLMQLNDLNYQQYALQQKQAFEASQTAYTTGANLQSQMLSGQISSALHAQDYNSQLGLGAQHFDTAASIENLQSTNRMAINRSNLNDQLDFMPKMSEAEYASQQAQFAKRFQALNDAHGSGLVTDDEYQSAQQDLISSQLGLRQQMPSRSDFAKDFEKNTYTDPTATMPDGNGGTMNVRYIRNPKTGEVSIDPYTQIQMNNVRYQAASKGKNMQTLFNHLSATSGNVMKFAQQLMSSVEGITPQQAMAMATTMAQQALQFGMGSFGGGQPQMAGVATE